MGPILLIDDQYDFRLMLRDLLEQNGHRVISVANGREALTVLEKHSFSLILTDLYMPMMDGIEMLSRLRSRGSAVPPVIVMTGYEHIGTSSARSAAEALGARAVLIKPFKGEDLLAAIGQVVPAPSTREQSGERMQSPISTG